MNLKKQTHELFLREERFSSIAELSPVGLYMTDADGSCEYVNERYSKLIGLSIEECMGEGWKDGLHPDDKVRIFKTWYESVANNDPVYINEYRTAKTNRDISVKAKALRTKDGEIYAFLGVIEPVLIELINKDGSVKKVEFRYRNTKSTEIWGLIDKTEILRLEAEKEKMSEMYDLILNATKIGVWNWDSNNNKATWNDSLFDLLGRERTSENLFKTYMERVHEDDKQTVLDNNIKLMKGVLDEVVSNFKFIRPDGELIYLRSIAKVERDNEGKTERMYGINIDIAEEKQYEKNLVVAKEKADAANNAKSIFLANMSHEIRTPMNAILGFAEILKNKNESPELENYIDGITKGGNTLLSLINDISDISKIEANKMTLKNSVTNFELLLDDIDKIFTIVANKKGIKFSIEMLPTTPKYMLLDQTKVKQILINLIGNAIKFTEMGSVKLDINYKQNPSDVSKMDLYLEVSDTGKGIEEKYLDKIFDPFTQEDNRDNKEYEGTGLGLSIVKKLTELYDGDTKVDTEVGVGSTFKVRLNGISISILKPKKFTNLEQHQIDNLDFNNLNILFAEDIESNRQVIKGLLSNSNLNLFFAENGEEALKIARENEISLGFIDLHMPVMDGRTMARIWKEDDSLNKIPIVALTAEMRDTNSDSDDLFSDYLTKPVSGIDLYRAIAKFVSPDSDINLSNTGNKTIIIKLDDNIIDEIKEKNLYGIVQESIKIVNTKELRYLITELQTISD